MSADWKLDDGRIIELITPEMLTCLKRGTILVSIFGETKKVGIDFIDNDTRFGRIAYGFLKVKK